MQTLGYVYMFLAESFLNKFYRERMISVMEFDDVSSVSIPKKVAQDDDYRQEKKFYFTILNRMIKNYRGSTEVALSDTLTILFMQTRFP